MITKSVSYGRTINIGNYESVRIEVTVEANPFMSSDSRELFDEAKRIISEEETIIRQTFRK